MNSILKYFLSPIQAKHSIKPIYKLNGLSFFSKIQIQLPPLLHFLYFQFDFLYFLIGQNHSKPMHLFNDLNHFNNIKSDLNILED